MAFTSANNKENVAVNAQPRSSTVHRRLHSRSLASSKKYEKHRSVERRKPTDTRRVLSLGLADEQPARSSSCTQPPRTISLPRKLRRPVASTVSSSALSTLFPDQPNISIEDIHKEIMASGQQMFATATKVTAICPKGYLPRELEVIINDLSAEPPTHIFAVYSQPSSSQKQSVVLHVVHALVLAANCAHLPPLPHSTITKSDALEGKITLPIIPLCLPSPSTFPILLAYLYTRRADHLVASLLPHLPQDDTQTLKQIAQRLVARCTVPTLLTHVNKTRELWKNVVALGICDKALWRAMDAVWEVLLDALAMSTGQLELEHEEP